MLLALTVAKGEHLPVKLYTMADGLPSAEIACTVRDSHGFLWFCASEGLSRFDGYQFVNYGVDQGLPDPRVADLVETRDGEYWLATASGISRFLPGSSREKDHAGGRRRRFFEVHRFPPNGQPLPRQPVQLKEAPDGRIWCLTTYGLLRFDRASKQFEPIDTGRHMYTSLFQDRDGSLWLGTDSNLIRLLPDGHVQHYGEAEGLPARRGDRGVGIGAILRDRDGRLWVGTWRGLCRMSARLARGKTSVERVYNRRDGLADNVVMALFQSHDGTIWVATQFGLSQFVPGSRDMPDRFRSYTPLRGFDLPGTAGLSIGDFSEDTSNNLWMVGLGALRLAGNAFTSYRVEHGLPTNSVESLFEDRDGRLIAVTEDPENHLLSVFDGDRFLPIAPRFPKGAPGFARGHGQTHMQDHTGAWWIATGQGLCRYPRVQRIEDLAHTRPERVFTNRDGLAGDRIHALYEDSLGDVWISVAGVDSVIRWSRGDGSIRHFRLAEGGRRLSMPTAFAEDRAGGLWMGLSWRDLARYRGGRFEVFSAADGLPEGVVSSLFLDHAGRLWVGSSQGGLARVDDPSAARPRFSLYSTRSGLASNSIACITEDAWGRIYAGTGRGVDRLDPETGRVRHFGEADGLRYSGHAKVAYRDRYGTLWFGSARLTPMREDASAGPPAIRITRIRVRGVERSISELGESRVEGLRLEPAENQVQIEFASLNFGVGESIRYQSRLEGMDKDWGPPVDSRSVNYPVLSPGSYRFLVRAVNAEGLTSTAPASVEFAIMPPFWWRWWFWPLTAGALGLAAVSARRYRLRQALQLERVRTRIATDLHDDIGSSLTQIAVLSEVVRKNMNGNKSEVARLSRIADLSRELVDSMGDIVWSINPQRDHLSDLAYRMRRFGSDVFTARRIDFDFTAPDRGEQTVVRAEVRRHTFLIFKECVHNVLRHAACDRVEVVLRADRRRLIFRMNDNGKGFARPMNGHGHGLSSMERRSREMGGRLEISSQPGLGTAVELRVPLDHKSRQVLQSETT